jgi:EmrB/QacA subfamily drug resistance transporter
MEHLPRAALVHDGIGEAAYRLRWWTLAVLSLSLVLVVMESASLNLAIPTLVRELGSTDTELQWMVDLYTLVFGGLLLSMGAVGDRFGRKGALQIGLAIFALASLFTALFASDSVAIIAGRGVMGVGAALVMPATLSILTHVFPADERAKAIGIWAAFAGLGALLGQVSSGLLLELFDWRSIFWIVVPIAAVAALGGIKLVPTSRDTDKVPLDLVGSILSTFGLGALLYAIIEGPTQGWESPATIGAGVVSFLAIVLFVRWERHTAHPMLPIELFGERSFTAGNLVVGLAFFSVFAMFFVVTQYMQFVQAVSPLEAALRFLPLGLGLMIGAPSSAQLAARFGATRIVAIGLLIGGGALGSFALLQADEPYWRLGASLFVAGLGLGLSMTPATTLIMSSVPTRKAGIGSSMNDTSREVGGALGVAVLGTIQKTYYASAVAGVIPAGLADAQRVIAESGLGGALAVAESIGPEGSAFAQSARDAFVAAMAPTFWTAFACAAAAALGVLAVFRRSSDPARAPMDSRPKVESGPRSEAVESRWR